MLRIGETELAEDTKDTAGVSFLALTRVWPPRSPPDLIMSVHSSFCSESCNGTAPTFSQMKESCREQYSDSRLLTKFQDTVSSFKERLWGPAEVAELSGWLTMNLEK